MANPSTEMDLFDDDPFEMLIYSTEKPADGIITSKSHGKVPARTLRWHHLMLLVYLNTVGGPFGIEPAVLAAGPLLTIIGIFIIGFGWGMPQSLMSAELALLCESMGNGGDFNWVYRGFGLFVAFLNATNNLTQFFVSNALLLTLFPGYWPVPLGFMGRALVMLVPAVLAATMNLLGIKFVNRVNTLIVPMVLIPFYFIFGYAIAAGKTANISVLTEVPPKVNVALYVSTGIWCFGGFDRVGNAAGEIHGGRPTYLRGLAGAVMLGFLTYAPPVFMLYLVTPDYTRWDSGAMVAACYDVGKWAGHAMVLTAMLSCFGQYSAAVFPLARLVWAVSVVKDPRRRMLPQWISTSSTNDIGVVTPWVSIVFCSCLCMVIALAPYVILVECFVVFRIINLACEYGALFSLRYREPDTPRPFRIPGGKPALWLLMMPVTSASIVLLSTASWVSLSIGLSSQLLFVGLYFARKALLLKRGVDFNAALEREE